LGSPAAQEIIDVVEKISSSSIDHVDDPAQDLPEDEQDNQGQEPLDVELHQEGGDDASPRPPPAYSSQPQATLPPAPLYDDPSDSSDGEGEWITPSNVALHKSHALSLLPSSSPSKGKGKDNNEEVIFAGCMTADFAMQNVLLQMGLSLVSTEGKRIEKVKSWVLRCHACFKCAFISPSQPDRNFLNVTYLGYVKTTRKSSVHRVGTPLCSEPQ
jgi:RNA-binding protein NOB1